MAKKARVKRLFLLSWYEQGGSLERIFLAKSFKLEKRSKKLRSASLPASRLSQSLAAQWPSDLRDILLPGVICLWLLSTFFATCTLKLGVKTAKKLCWGLNGKNIPVKAFNGMHTKWTFLLRAICSRFIEQNEMKVPCAVGTAESHNQVQGVMTWIKVNSCFQVAG